MLLIKTHQHSHFVDPCVDKIIDTVVEKAFSTIVNIAVDIVVDRFVDTVVDKKLIGIRTGKPTSRPECEQCSSRLRRGTFSFSFFL